MRGTDSVAHAKGTPATPATRHTRGMRPVFDTTLILPVAPTRWPPPAGGVTVDGIDLQPKEELHITLVGGKLGRELVSVFGKARARERVAAAFDARHWEFERTGRYLLLRKAAGDGKGARPVHSIIEMVDLPAMASFQRSLGEALGRELPMPPAHVTLYVAGRRRGIGVSSEVELRALRVRDVAATELAG